MWRLVGIMLLALTACSSSQRPADAPGAAGSGAGGGAGGAGGAGGSALEGGRGGAGGQGGSGGQVGGSSCRPVPSNSISGCAATYDEQAKRTNPPVVDSDNCIRDIGLADASAGN